MNFYFLQMQQSCFFVSTLTLGGFYVAVRLPSALVAPGRYGGMHPKAVELRSLLPTVSCPVLLATLAAAAAIDLAAADLTYRTAGGQQHAAC